jgi:hypothetical protein
MPKGIARQRVKYGGLIFSGFQDVQQPCRKILNVSSTGVFNANSGHDRLLQRRVGSQSQHSDNAHATTATGASLSGA